jgi:uncharacterized membrane protein YqaE (UPF0057 family)
MKTKLLPIAIVALSVFLFSCSSSLTISKKRYSNGYYVSVSKQEQASEAAIAVAPIKTIKTSSKALLQEEQQVQTLATAPIATASLPKASSAEIAVKTSNNTAAPLAKKIQKVKTVLQARANKSTIKGEEELSDRFLIVLLVTILIPPLGVYLYKKALRPTVIDLILFVLGCIVSAAGIGLPFLGLGLGYLAALIYGLFYIFGQI